MMFLVNSFIPGAPDVVHADTTAFLIEKLSGR